MPDPSHDQTRDHMMRLAMGLSLAVAVLMLTGKLGAAYITGSTAIVSDAVESMVHILATGIAAYSLWLSRQGACERHPYGHGKIAYFSAGFEGALILSAALFILYSSVIDLWRGAQVSRPGIGLLVTCALLLVNLALGLFLVQTGRRHNALILVANGKHVLTDMWTSLGVVVGIGLVWLTGETWLDPLAAFLVGVNILWTSGRLISRSFAGLLDAADPEKTDILLDTLKQARDDGRILNYHQLRHRQSNDVMWVEWHALMPDEAAIQKAHKDVTHVENTIRSAFPGYEVQITTHIEPAGHATAHPGGHDGFNDPYASVEPSETEEEGNNDE